MATTMVMVMAKMMMIIPIAMAMAIAKRMMIMAIAMAGGSLQPLVLP